MRYDTDQVYALLPQIYRIRDANDGGLALRALVEALASQASVVERDIAQRYDSAFIETCELWVIPYIADLLGVRNLLQVPGAAYTARARVANTIAFRRRKGTATMLEQLARDTTGWPAHAVEFFERLQTTQWLNHLRPHSLRTPDLRDAGAIELVGGPFDTTAHTADVRRIAPGRGKHNIPNVGLFLWRLQAYPQTDANPRALASPGDGRYTFNPIGIDAPLFNLPQTERDITHLAEEVNVPGSLRRRPLHDEIEARRQALVDATPHTPVWFGEQPPVGVMVRDNAAGPLQEVPPEQIVICDLSEPPVAIPEIWRRPPNAKAYLPAGGGAAQNLPIICAIDPLRGRLAFPAGSVPAEVRVSYAYGFAGDIGGGPYNRRDSVAALLQRPPTWQAGVSRDTVAVGGEPIFTSLAAAVQAWNAQAPGTCGLIALMDSLSYDIDLTGAANRIRIPAGSRLVIAAADWPVTVGDGNVQQRVIGAFNADGMRPHLRGNLEALGGTAAEDKAGGELAIDGVLIEGGLEIVKGQLARLSLSHTTLLPGGAGLSLAAGNDAVQVALSRAIVASLSCKAEAAEINVTESIIDAGSEAAVAAPKAHVAVQAATLFGSVKARSFDAGNSIFTQKVDIERCQQGCVRFCFVPDKSSTPRRHRCQPDLALAQPNAVKTNELARVRPQFVATQYAQPGYAQLAGTCAGEIALGAEDGGEMGAWHLLQNAARVANLRVSLDEYLRVGLEAGLFFVT